MDPDQKGSPEISEDERSAPGKTEAGVYGPGTEPSVCEDHDVSVDTDSSELRDPALPYPVVGIGGSSGGVEALRDMLEQLSPQTGLAFVYVSHHPLDDETQLAELQRQTPMPVHTIEEGQRPLPNHLYVLPPQRSLTLERGEFRLQPDQADDTSAGLVNQFFRSLAEDQRNFSIGVVLSGENEDGAEGLKSIKGEGGFALVQSPDSAVEVGMPRSSIAADHVDVVLPPATLAAELERIAHHFARPEVRLLEEGRAPRGEDHAFDRILQLLRNQSGLEVRQYKPQTIRRRIARRMVLLRMDTVNDYFSTLR